MLVTRVTSAGLHVALAIGLADRGLPGVRPHSTAIIFPHEPNRKDKAKLQGLVRLLCGAFKRVCFAYFG